MGWWRGGANNQAYFGSDAPDVICTAIIVGWGNYNVDGKILKVEVMPLSICIVFMAITGKVLSG